MSAEPIKFKVGDLVMNKVGIDCAGSFWKSARRVLEASGQHFKTCDGTWMQPPDGIWRFANAQEIADYYVAHPEEASEAFQTIKFYGKKESIAMSTSNNVTPSTTFTPKFEIGQQVRRRSTGQKFNILSDLPATVYDTESGVMHELKKLLVVDRKGKQHSLPVNDLEPVAKREPVALWKAVVVTSFLGEALALIAIAKPWNLWTLFTG